MVKTKFKMDIISEINYFKKIFYMMMWQLMIDGCLFKLC
jgi:hypothetical protein